MVADMSVGKSVSPNWQDAKELEPKWIRKRGRGVTLSHLQAQCQTPLHTTHVKSDPGSERDPGPSRPPGKARRPTHLSRPPPPRPLRRVRRGPSSSSGQASSRQPSFVAASSYRPATGRCGGFQRTRSGNGALSFCAMICAKGGMLRSGNPRLLL